MKFETIVSGMTCGFLFTAGGIAVSGAKLSVGVGVLLLLAGFINSYVYFKRK